LIALLLALLGLTLLQALDELRAVLVRKAGTERPTALLLETFDGRIIVTAVVYAVLRTAVRVFARLTLAIAAHIFTALAVLGAVEAALALLTDVVATLRLSTAAAVKASVSISTLDQRDELLCALLAGIHEARVLALLALALVHAPNDRRTSRVLLARGRLGATLRL